MRIKLSTPIPVIPAASALEIQVVSITITHPGILVVYEFIGEQGVILRQEKVIVSADDPLAKQVLQAVKKIVQTKHGLVP